jgi:hypothetical protein
MIFGNWLWPLRRRQLRSRLAAHVGCKRTGTITSTMSCEQAPRAIESANLDRSTVDVRSRELLVPVFPFVWQRVSDLFWVAPYLFWLARLDVLRGRNGCLGLLEGDCGSPFRGMDSAESSELSFLRFAQRRLIRPPRASLISPSDKRHDGKHNRNGQGNHSQIGITMSGNGAPQYRSRSQPRQAAQRSDTGLSTIGSDGGMQ